MQENTAAGPELLHIKYKFTFTHETSVDRSSLFIYGRCELSQNLRLHSFHLLLIQTGPFKAHTYFIGAVSEQNPDPKIHFLITFVMVFRFCFNIISVCIFVSNKGVSPSL